jgi:hypothetical protein
MVKITSQRGRRAGLAAAGLAAIVGLGACQSPGLMGLAFNAGAHSAPNRQLSSSFAVAGGVINAGNANNGQNQTPIQGASPSDSNSIIRCTYPTGDSYEGTFKDGKKSGYGKYRWANGNIYVGMFEEDALHGKGTLRDPTGREWEGIFSGGKLNGETTIRDAAGREWKVIYRDGTYVGPVEKRIKQDLTGIYASSNSGHEKKLEQKAPKVRLDLGLPSDEE